MINSENKNTTDEDQIKRNLEDLNYPANEDIYNQEDKLEDIDPEDISNERTINQNNYKWKQNNDKFGDDLDVPGSELNDEQEEIGAEDEENNLYSEGDNN
ncbi:hypothetical protein [Flavobacterium soyae]|uniref:hypothetical protein n=1 Tax=Flavobacterium soyae TaxID=2903098 RepID=UPI001E2C3716|nr:hypothetical protein [Flavobacterium soyae]MCD9577498.1 hypothetical protein [Flavobacterium soyae]